jgi:hypothetical protein
MFWSNLWSLLIRSFQNLASLRGQDVVEIGTRLPAVIQLSWIRSVDALDHEVHLRMDVVRHTGPDDRTPTMLFEQAVCKENVKYILNHLQYPIGYPHLVAAPSSSLL